MTSDIIVLQFGEAGWPPDRAHLRAALACQA
jgi:hypothetical protein